MANRNATYKALQRRRRLTRRARRKHETHERILESARTIARREGLRASSVSRVMSGAGLTVGGFYAHFPSKTAMDVEVIRTLLGNLPGRWLSGLEEFSGLEWVRQAVGRYLNVAHRDYPDGCPYSAVLSEIAAAPDEVRHEFAVALEARVRAFEAHVPRIPGFTVRERALATMALTIGGLLLSRASRGNPISEGMLVACKRWALPELDGVESR